MSKQPPVPEHNYCTYFDSGYLPRALALFDSLAAHGDTAPIWVLAMDTQTAQYLARLGRPGLNVVTPDELETAEPELRAVRAGRTRMEYYFTCTPLLMKYVQDKLTHPESVAIYLDADLFFFDDPAIVLNALGTDSIGIIEHRYPKRLERQLAKYGRFNVGWVGIRNDASGRACIDWWSRSCLDWCFDAPEDGRYADQGYLDQFPERFDYVRVLDAGGLNLAPWNTGRHALTTVSKSDHAQVLVDGRDPLVFFHFHGIRRRGRWFVTSQLLYRSRMTTVLRKHIYSPYLSSLDRSEATVHARMPEVQVARRGKGVRGAVFGFQRWAIDWISIMTGNAIKLADFTQHPLR